jgi:subtilisin family serine protease
MSTDLAGKHSSAMVDVIVQFTQIPTARHHQKVLSRGGTLKQELGVVKAGAYSIPASALADLAADPEVVYISPDRHLAGFLNNGAPAVNAPYAWAKGLDGSNMAVAVIDSGIQDNTAAASLLGAASATKLENLLGEIVGNPDLDQLNSRTSRVVYSQSWVNDGNGAMDVYGHGTNVAGINGSKVYQDVQGHRSQRQPDQSSRSRRHGHGNR